MKSNAFAVFTVAALLLTACHRPSPTPAASSQPAPQPQAAPQASGEPIKIGLTSVLTGPVGNLGTKIMQGAQIALEDWNARGGLLGRKIEPVIRDDEGKPEKAVLVAQELVNQGVVAVFGPVYSGCTLPASPIYYQNRIPEITVSTNQEITERGFDTLFRCNGRDDQQGSVAADFAKNKLGITKLAVFHNKSAFGEGIAKRVKETFQKAGGEVVMFEGISESELDFRSSIAALKTSGAQGVYWGGIYSQAGPFFNQLREAGLEIPFISCDGSFDQSMIDTIGKQPKAFYASFAPDWSKQPGAKEFEEKFRAKYGEPGTFAFYGYDAINLLFTAIEKAGSTKADDIIRALRENTFEAILGHLKFDAKGDLVEMPYVMWTIADGKFKQLE